MMTMWRLLMVRALFEWRRVPLGRKLRFVIWKDRMGW